MAQEMTRLSDFLARLAEEPDTLGRFILQREELLAEVALSEKDKQLLRTGSLKEIQSAVQQEIGQEVPFFYLIR